MECKEIAKVNKKLGEMTKVFQGFRNPKKGGHKHFFYKQSIGKFFLLYLLIFKTCLDKLKVWENVPPTVLPILL